MIGRQMTGSSWLHRLPAPVKLLLLVAGGAMIFPVTDRSLLLVCLAAVLSLYASLRVEGLRQLLYLRPLLWLLVFFLGLHGLAGTWETGLSAVLRLLVMVLAANLVSVTTRMDDMINAIRPVFAPLRWIGLSPQKPALAISLVIRFAPVLLFVYGSLSDAYRARTGRATSWRLIAPLALQAVRMSENVAEALSARGGSRGLARRGKDTPQTGRALRLSTNEKG